MRMYKLIINLLFIIAFIVVIWINFFEDLYITTTFFKNADKFNRLVENISMTYITSYIFYIIIYVFKSKQDERVILPFIADYVFVAMNNCVYFCYSMRSKSGLEYFPFETSIYDRNTKIYPNEEELKIICSKINPNEIDKDKPVLPGFTPIPHFFGVMIKYVHSIDYFIKIVLEKSAFLDVELLRILTDIQTHGFHQEMMSYDKSMLLTAKHRHDNLMIYKDSLRTYFELFIKLEKYSKDHLKQYVERESLKVKSINK